jgi:hypothetical protein
MDAAGRKALAAWVGTIANVALVHVLAGARRGGRRSPGCGANASGASSRSGQRLNPPRARRYAAGIQLEPELPDQVGLGLQVIDVSFLVAHERLEQIARDVILERVAMDAAGRLRSVAQRFRRQPTGNCHVTCRLKPMIVVTRPHLHHATGHDPPMAELV